MSDLAAPELPDTEPLPVPSLPAPTLGPPAQEVSSVPVLPPPAAAPAALVPAPPVPSLPVPSLPVLPSPAAVPVGAPVPAVPVLTAPPQPAAPVPAVPVLTAPAESGPSNDPVDESAQSGGAMASAAEMFTASEPEADPSDVVVEEQRPRIPTRMLRIAVIAGTAVATGAAIGLRDTSPAAASCAAILPALALIAWTWCAVTNAGRSRPANQHHSAPRPAWAALSWLLAPALAVPGVMALYRVDEWADAATFEQEGTRTLGFAGSVLIFGAIMLWAIYRPYSILGRASRWVSGDGDKFRRWFLGPFFVIGLCAAGVFFSAMRSVEVDAAGAPETVGIAGLTGEVIGLLSLLPLLAWLILGSRAMIDMEEAIGHQHRRRSAEEDPVAPMNPLMAAQSAAMAEQSTQP